MKRRLSVSEPGKRLVLGSREGRMCLDWMIAEGLPPPPPHLDANDRALLAQANVEEEEEEDETFDVATIVRNGSASLREWLGLELTGRGWRETEKQSLLSVLTMHTNQKNRFPFDERIRADHTRTRHDYYIDGVKRTDFVSPSGLLHDFFEPFDEDAKAAQCAKSGKGEYAGLTADGVKALWEQNRRYGSAKHRGYEKVLQGEPLVKDDPDDSDEEEVLPPDDNFYRAVLERFADKYDVYRSEWSIVLMPYHLVGQIDLVGVNRATGQLRIFDFKNCKDEDLTRLYWRTPKGTHPFTIEMDDNKINHYVIQLSVYHRVLRQLLTPYCIELEPEVEIWNFRPAEPTEYQMYSFAPLDLRKLMPLLRAGWRRDDPRHADFCGFHADRLVIAPVPADVWARDVPHVTEVVRVDKGPLPPDVFYTGRQYTKGGYALPDSPLKLPFYRGPKEPLTQRDLNLYEYWLLSSPQRLLAVAEIAHEHKRLACWCFPSHNERPAGTACHADIICKYCDVMAAGRVTWK